MATLEEVKKLLQEANEGSTPAVELQQEYNLETSHALIDIASSLNSISSGKLSLNLEDLAEKSKKDSNDSLEKVYKILLDQFNYNKKRDLSEDRDSSVSITPKDDGKKDKRDEIELEVPTKFLEGLGLTLGAVTGFISGFVTEIVSFVKNIGAAIKAMSKSTMTAIADTKIGSLITKIFSGIKGFFATVVEFSEALLLYARNGFNQSKIGAKIGEVFLTFRSYFGALTETIKSLASGEGVVLRSIKNIFSAIAKPFVSLAKEVKAIGSSFSIGGKLGKLFAGFNKFFDMFKGFFSKLGNIFGKLAAPITVIMGIFETVKGSLDFVTRGMENGENQIQLAISGILGAFTGFGNFFIEIVDLIKDGVSWIGKKIFGPDNPVTKLLDSFSLVEIFTNLMVGLNQFINHDLVEGVTKVWTEMKEFFSGISRSVEIGLTSITKVFSVVWENIEKAIQRLVGFFSSEDGEENDDKVQTVKDLFTKMKDKVMGIFTSIKDAFKSFTDMLHLPDLNDLLPDVDAIIDGAKNYFSGLIDKAIKFFKDKLNFFGGDDDDADKDTTVDDLKSSGALTKTGKFDYGDAAIEESTLKTLTIAQIETIQAEYPDKGGYKKLHVQLREEVASRLVPASASKVGTGTVGTALNSVPAVPMVLQSAGRPAPSTGNITGLAQESVGQSGTMNNAQASLNETKTINYVSQSAGNNTVVNADNSTSVVNTSVHNPPVSPAMDTSDRTTGSYRDYMSYR